MSDEEILCWATSEERILITMDKDFSEFALIQTRRHSGIIRLENLAKDIRIEHLKKILALHSKELTQKVIIIQKGSKIRIIH